MSKRKQSTARKAKRAKKQIAYRIKKSLPGLAIVLLIILGVGLFSNLGEQEPEETIDDWSYVSEWDKEMDRLNHRRKPIRREVKVTATLHDTENSEVFKNASETIDAPYVGTSITGGEEVFVREDLGDSAQVVAPTTEQVTVHEEVVNIDDLYQQMESVDTQETQLPDPTPAPTVAPTPTPDVVVEQQIQQQQDEKPVEVEVAPVENTEVTSSVTEENISAEETTVEKTVEELDAECKGEDLNSYYSVEIGGCAVNIVEHTAEEVVDEGEAL